MYKYIILLASLVFLFSCTTRQEADVVSNNQNPQDKTIKQLVASMSLEEKVGQMTQITLDVLTKGYLTQDTKEPVELDTSVLQKAFGKYFIGSVLNTANNRSRTPEEWNRIIGKIQEYALKYAPHHIPVLYGLDMIHGASYASGATLFPQQIGMAATWNPTLIRIAGEITAYETRACGVPWTFSPVLDLGLDPRWPRQWETFGEDPYLASVMGTQLIKGYEGMDNLADKKYHIAACLKHFLGYSQPLSGKDRTPAWIPEHLLREYHLPSFKAGIQAGAHSVMVNSGDINGMPVHADPKILTDLLKKELNYKGFTVSDWQDIEFLHQRHHLVESNKEAVKTAINAGIDMSMVPYNFEFADYLVQLVKEGEVSETRINDAVTRILKVKMELGLFENPMTKAEDYPDFGSEKFAVTALETATESITLLKNKNNILPLSKNTKILLAGPAANFMRPLNGGWSYSWQGELVDEFAGHYQTLYEALRETSDNAANISLFDGLLYDSGEYRNEKLGNWNDFHQQADLSDVIVLCLGENTYTETPGNLINLALSDNQQALAREAAKTGKAVVMVLIEGRPRLINSIEPLMQGIVQAYLPGNYGGKALADILLGECNPSGKLPYTYPRNPNSLEKYYHKYTETLSGSGAPAGTTFDPQFEFGFGLSYSTFSYSDLRLNKTNFGQGDAVVCSVTVENTSIREGKDVIQVYVSDHYASLTPPVKRLRAFDKISLKPGESKRVSLEIPVDQLGFVHRDNSTLVEKGTFTLRIGPLSTDFSVGQTFVVD